jgi:hypothetical protein
VHQTGRVPCTFFAHCNVCYVSAFVCPLYLKSEHKSNGAPVVFEWTRYASTLSHRTETVQHGDVRNCAAWCRLECIL